MNELALDIELDRGDFRLAIKESLDLSGITAVFGANGSGKTSLLRVIAGLESSTKGTLLFRDQEWQGQSGIWQPEARAIGYVFQDGRLFSHLDVKGNLEFPARHGRRVGPIKFDEAVRAFELEHLLTRYPGALSGGERQRVAIARALLANPSLLLMDEPLSSLDHARKRDLLPLIKKLPAHYEIPIIYVTHDIDELVYLADSVVLLANGQNIAHGSAREILERSDFEQIAELRDSGNVLEAEISSHIEGATIISLPTGELRIPKVDGSPGETVRLRINPRDVVLATEELSGISIRNSLPATIRAIDHQQDEQSLISLTVGAQRVSARVTSDAVRDLDLHEGKQVYALIKTVALDVFAAR